MGVCIRYMCTYVHQRRIIAGFLLLGLLFPLAALDVPTRRIEDDSALRLSLRDFWFVESADRVLNRKAFIHTLYGGGKIQVRTEASKDEFSIILAREWNGTYPGWAQGSWILTRQRDTGSPSRIRIFLRSDPYTYIQFRPVGSDRCLMDVVLYDAYVLRSLPVPYAIERLMVIPVEEVLATVGESFPRKYFDPNPDMYRDLRAFMHQLRARLPELAYQDDGAIDDTGKYVYIETLKAQDANLGLNCSGFAKWVIDGILRPFTGTRLSIPPLKQAFGERGSSISEYYEDLDIFFGLDWTRNLASIAGTTMRSSEFGKLEEFEIQNQPFSLVIQRSKSGTSLQSNSGFLLNAGFHFEGIHPLLYTLAINEPGNIYLASINKQIVASPPLHQHFHVAVLVPYFDEQGNFKVAVFESAEETSFNRFKNRYPGHFFNLVRIPVESSFDP